MARASIEDPAIILRASNLKYERPAMSTDEVNRQYAILMRQGAMLQSNENYSQQDDAYNNDTAALLKVIDGKRKRESLPSIKKKVRVNSSGAVGTQLRESIDASTPTERDPFTRVNKFKNVGIASSVVSNGGALSKSNGAIKKPRYSCQDVVTQLGSLSQSRALSGDGNESRFQNQQPILEEINVLDLVNKGKNACLPAQLKPISTRSNALATFEVQKSIGLFQTANQENNSQMLSQSTRRSITKPVKSILPQGVAKGTERPLAELISISNKATQKSRKISITCINNQIIGSSREAHSQCQTITHQDEDYLSSTREYQSRRIGVPQNVMLSLWAKLFDARCEDLGLRSNEKQLKRYLKGIQKHSFMKKLILNEQGYGPKSAPVLGQIIRNGSSLAEWTHLDLSLNKLGLNFGPIIAGLKANNQLVSARLSNNDLGGREHIQLIKTLVKDHQTLTDLDVSNDESNQNKNRLGNAGLEAIIEGVLESKTSVLSMINIAQNNILSSQQETLPLLRALLTIKQDQIVALNLGDNDLGQDFFQIMGYDALSNLKELKLANTRLTNKSMQDLSEHFSSQRISLLHLDISSNYITIEGFFKLLSELKNNLTLRKLNFSRNDLNFEATGALGPHYVVMEQFITLNRSVEELNLSDCKLGYDGASILGKGLRRNQKLQRLNLSQNKFEDRGLLLILEGILDNISTTSQMTGLAMAAPITDLDVSKNAIELKDVTVRTQLFRLLTDLQSKLQSISLRDNLIRDEPAEAICIALKQNLSIMKFQIDMNPIKHATLKDLESSVKRNVFRHKEKQAPAIKREINNLYQERQRVIEELPNIPGVSGNQKSLIQTAVHLDQKAKMYEKEKTLCKQQFMADDRKLDMIRDEAHRLERMLIEERERARDRRRDVDFEDEQQDERMVKQDRVWQKQLLEQQEKVDIVKLAQTKTIDERLRLNNELEKKKDRHQMQMDAYGRELQIVMREQALSAMIQESYSKEIDRVKKAMIAATEVPEEVKVAEHPPSTAQSGHRFANKKPQNQRRGNSTLRRMESNGSGLHAEPQKRGPTTIRNMGHQPKLAYSNHVSHLQIQKENSTATQQHSPGQKLRELQQLKKEVKQQRRRQEEDLKLFDRKQSLSRGISLEREKHAFRLPAQQNLPS